MTMKIGNNLIEFNDGTQQDTAFVKEFLGWRNRVINGDMSVIQRTGQGAFLPAGAGGSLYGVDRFPLFVDPTIPSSTVATGQSGFAPDGFPGSLYVQTAGTFSVTAAQGFIVRHGIEGTYIRDLAWGTANARSVILGFWVRATLTGTYAFGISNAAADRCYVSEYTVNAANTWEFKWFIVPGCKDGTWNVNTNLGAHIRFDFGSGSNYITSSQNTWTSGATKFRTTNSKSLAATPGTWWVTGVQFEPLIPAYPLPTPFEYRMNELQLSQRYYFKNTNCAVTGYNSAGIITYADIYHPVEMRAPPSVTLSSISYNNASNAILNNNSTKNCRFQITQTATGSGYAVFTAEFSAEI